MVLHWLRCGRVGRSRTYFKRASPFGRPFCFVQAALGSMADRDARWSPRGAVRRLRLITSTARRVPCPRTSQAVEATTGDRPDPEATAAAVAQAAQAAQAAARGVDAPMGRQVAVAPARHGVAPAPHGVAPAPHGVAPAPHGVAPAPHGVAGRDVKGRASGRTGAGKIALPATSTTASAEAARGWLRRSRSCLSPASLRA
jgi:hypothetical protein